MNIAFAGLRHGHIFSLAELAKKNPDFSITGWWEEDEESSRNGRSFFVDPPYASYEELLADQKVDIVAIGDYYGIRGRRIIQALLAGKHVLCDKPVCTSLEELDEIGCLLEHNHLKLGCMLDLRYEPCIRHLSTLIASDALGDIKTACFTGQHPLNLGVRPNWYFEEGKHGGTFNDIAIHGIDAIHFLLGAKSINPLYARQWNAFATFAPDFLDCAQCVLETDRGVNVLADVSYSAPSPGGFHTPAYWRFTLWGTKGFAECRINDPSITVLFTNEQLPHQIISPPIENDYLKDFKREIDGKSVCFDTQSVLRSTRNALLLQEYANQKG